MNINFKECKNRTKSLATTNAVVLTVGIIILASAAATGQGLRQLKR
jgi:hypothetical protein